MDKRILGLFTLMTLAFLTTAIVPVIAGSENDNITVSVTIAGTITQSVLTSNGRTNGTAYTQNFTAEMTGGDTSITFDTTEPDERAGTEGLAWDVGNTVEVASNEAAEGAGCATNDDCVDWIVIQNAGDTVLDVAAGTADIDGTADENGDGQNANDNILFPEAHTDYATRANLFIKCEEETAADINNLTTTLGYTANGNLASLDLDFDGTADEDINDATWLLEADTYNVTLTNGSGESGPAAGSRINLAQGLPWIATEDVFVCYLAFETPDNALLRAHSVKLVIYAADDTTGLTNEANA